MADKNHRPVWPLPCATSGWLCVSWFRSRGFCPDRSTCHWGCSCQELKALNRAVVGGTLRAELEKSFQFGGAMFQFQSLDKFWCYSSGVPMPSGQDNESLELAEDQACPGR